MADEQPNTPLEGAQAPDEATAEPVSDESREGSSPGWWGRLFNRHPAAPEATTDDGEPSEPDRPSDAPQQTQEELERRVQAEVDRREAKRAAESRALKKRELRDTDPWAYAEEEKKDEQAAVGTFQLEQLVSNIGTEHDRVAIDPIFTALPKDEQERIQRIEGAGQGLAGRRLIVQESLKALEKHWKAEGAKDAEARLRRNQSFRKQVLAE